MDGPDEQQRSLIAAPDGPPPAAPGADAGPADAGTGGIAQPDKAIRVGQMARQLLDEVRTIPLDESARDRLQAAHERSVSELASALSPDLADELCTLMAPLDDDRTPSAAELMIVQAQLVGWLEGLFQGIRASILAQQLGAQQQLDDMRRGRPESDSGRRGTYL